MNKLPIHEIDGRLLYYTFIAGAKNIMANQSYLNKINVFPVNDGDTGSNMATTLQSVIESIHPHKSYKITADLIAETTMTNARGNSGIIFAQLLYGISKESGNRRSITIPQFAESIKNSIPYMYEAVANPVEGTILTVIKDWSEFIYNQRNSITDFNQLFIRSREVAVKSLSETKQKLFVLAKANVVDAGANAFVFFIEGIIDFIRENSIRKLLRSKTESIVLPDITDHKSEEVRFRYCTEGILKNLSVDQKSLSKILQQYGDSIVIGGNEKTKHIHVHTNNPAEMFQQLDDISLVTFHKADDMLRQSEAIFNRKSKIALVTDSTCDLPQKIIDMYQINLLPININFGENHYLDKITIQPGQFYSLLDKHSEFPKTSQINEKAFVNLYSQLSARYDSIIAIHLTEKFSGTCFNSQKAAKIVNAECNKPISVINSKNLSGALGLIVLRAAQAIESGHLHDEIVAMVEKWIRYTQIYVSVRTLKYMVRGGRVSPIKGFMAKIMNVNPIVSMDENGASFVFGKTYSQQSNMEKVMAYLYTTRNGREIWNYIVLHAQNEEAAAWYAIKMKEFAGKEPLAVVNISPVIGANAGIGTAAVALMFK
ncbi:MAG: DegV family EDD domain-containing protein [Bacteroidales bacterium]|nr:DegV family EDD domain-containing protein [Bacteroidales bacterium]